MSHADPAIGSAFRRTTNRWIRQAIDQEFSEVTVSAGTYNNPTSVRSSGQAPADSPHESREVT
jgi:hypothetical protein